MTDAEKLDILKKFLHRVNGYGYLELSRDKIEGEYRYCHKRARELLGELFPEDFVREERKPSGPVDMDF